VNSRAAAADRGAGNFYKFHDNGMPELPAHAPIAAATRVKA
jgi:hypothetical protein